MSASTGKPRWQEMRVSHVGSVADVMQKKSGPHFDPSPVHTVKRGHGPK
jgi:hypothetical protein